MHVYKSLYTYNAYILICLYIYLLVGLSVSYSLHLSSRMSPCLPACLSVCLSVCLLFCLPVYLIEHLSPTPLRWNILEEHPLFVSPWPIPCHSYEAIFVPHSSPHANLGRVRPHQLGEVFGYRMGPLSRPFVEVVSFLLVVPSPHHLTTLDAVVHALALAFFNRWRKERQVFTLQENKPKMFR